VPGENEFAVGRTGNSSPLLALYISDRSAKRLNSASVTRKISSTDRITLAAAFACGKLSPVFTLRHKWFTVVRVYELGDPILMDNFGLKEFDDLCSYYMSHRLQPD